MSTSWVIIEKSTSKAVLETFEKKTAEHIRTMKNYEVVPILEYLQSINGVKK